MQLSAQDLMLKAAHAIIIPLLILEVHLGLTAPMLECIEPKSRKRAKAKAEKLCGKASDRVYQAITLSGSGQTAA